MRNLALPLALLLPAIAFEAATAAAPALPARARIEADADAGRPLVAHVVVALCDNQHQGIVPVPKALGNGQDPKSNLYWGARYGLKTFLVRDAGWKPVPCDAGLPEGLLERLVLTRQIARPGGATAAAYLVAEAWDGRRIREAIGRFLEMAGGHHVQTWRVRSGGRAVAFRGGGAAHVVAYVGHNGLMEFAAPDQPKPVAEAPPRSAIVLACKSQPYFDGLLRGAGARRLLLTTGFMAPEAYALDAALKSWLGGDAAAQSREAAAQAYHRYQKCGLPGARRLFWTER